VAHSLPRMRRKLRAFELFLTEGLFACTWQRSDFEVLLLASSDRSRAKDPRSATRQFVGHQPNSSVIGNETALENQGRVAGVRFELTTKGL
jgi:hypothetical protein